MESASGVKPRSLIFRCYLRPDADQPERWLAYCVDLTLIASGASPEEARDNLSDMIGSYVETVFDTEDVESIPGLLRRGPIHRRLLWEANFRLGRMIHYGAERLYRYTPPFSLGRATA